MPDSTFTFRVDETLKTEFTVAARAEDRNGAQLLREYMRSYVRERRQRASHDAWFRSQVQAGLEAANAGDHISADEVEAEAIAWRAEIRGAIEGNQA